MRLQHRKPITSLSSQQIAEHLSRHLGAKTLDYSFGFYVGAGWNDILFDLNKKLEAEKPDYQIHQIKEKFGGLRFYTDPMTDVGWDHVTDAENLSFKTCEECGRPGKIWNHKGWVKTLCWLDNLIDRINTHLWGLHRKGLTTYFKTYFSYRRLMRKRKGSAEN